MMALLLLFSFLIFFSMPKLPTLLISAFAVLIVVGAGCEGTSQTRSPTGLPSTPPAEMQKTEPISEGNIEVSTSTSAASVTNDTAMKAEEGSERQMMKPTIAAVSRGSYEPYEPSKLSRANTGNVVLFFHASWCPACKKVDSDIKNNLKDLPSDLSLLMVDYDSSTELKKKYGVTYQHTFVQVDAQGALLKKWSGGSTLESVVLQVI